MSETPKVDTHHKALQINLDPKIFGTFAEIGAGQEVARWFIQVGGASGTVAKTISAYDMTFSDAIYGKGSRRCPHWAGRSSSVATRATISSPATSGGTPRSRCGSPPARRRSSP